MKKLLYTKSKPFTFLTIFQASSTLSQMAQNPPFYTVYENAGFFVPNVHHFTLTFSEMHLWVYIPPIYRDSFGALCNLHWSASLKEVQCHLQTSPLCRLFPFLGNLRTSWKAPVPGTIEGAQCFRPPLHCEKKSHWHPLSVSWSLTSF